MFAGPWKSALDLGAYTIKHNIHRIKQCGEQEFLRTGALQLASPRVRTLPARAGTGGRQSIHGLHVGVVL